MYFHLSDDDEDDEDEDEGDDDNNLENADGAKDTSKQDTTSQTSENSRRKDLFAAHLPRAPRWKSKYNKLDDGDIDDDERECDNLENESKSSSKYSKIIDRRKDPEEKVLSKPKLFGQNTRKNSQPEINLKDDAMTEQKHTLKASNPSLPQNHSITKPRRRRESSSSHADEDSITEQKGTEFHYRELDDEYGSRPSAVTSVAKPKDHDVISIISTSSQEYDPAPKPQQSHVQMRNVKDDCEREKTDEVVQDPIIGHEHGVRPLLDDDELENSYEGQQPPRPVDTIDLEQDAVCDTPVQDTSMSPDTVSPVPKPEFTDIFGAAPFKRKSSRKKRPNSGVFTAPKSSSKDENLYKLGSVKPPVPNKPSWAAPRSSHNEDTHKSAHVQRSSRSRRHARDEEMSQGLIASSEDSDSDEVVVAKDVFGRAPFMKRSSSSVDTFTPSMLSLGDSVKNTQYSHCDEIFPANSGPSYRNSMENSRSSDSIRLKPDAIPDSFGAKPFITMQSVATSISTGPSQIVSQSVNNFQVSQFTQSVTSQGFSPSAQVQSTSPIVEISITDRKPAKLLNVTDLKLAKSPDIGESQVNWRDSAKVVDGTNYTQVTNYKKFKDESDSDVDENDLFESVQGRKYSKIKTSRSPRPPDHNIETSAFSNMSFNDDFDEEETEIRNFDNRLSSSTYNDTQQDSYLGVETEKQSTFTKEPSPVNQESVQPSYGGTWPRKRHKLPQKFQATAAPFTVKKRVDGIFK